MQLFHFQPKSHQRKRDYEFGRTLGIGGYGEVKLVKETKTGKEFACKVIEKKIVADMEYQLRRQNLLLDLHHNGVIKLHEWFESKERFYLIFELAAGGELYQHLLEATRFKEPEAREVASTLTKALSYLHARGVVHRDLKLENVLYRSTEFSDCCISDFGLAAQLEGRPLFNHCGSAGYTAPEVYTPGGYGAEVDMWSLGVVVFCLMGGRFPYKNTEPLALAEEARTTKLYFPRTWDDISADAKDFVSRCLVVDPKKRMTAAEALEHPWFKTPLPAPQPLPSPELSRVTSNRPILERQRTNPPPLTSQAIERRQTVIEGKPEATSSAIEKRETIIRGRPEGAEMSSGGTDLSGTELERRPSKAEMDVKTSIL
ncbi:hypothetical protein P7C70_g1946, partial [Phenoliferia sp. Uapishka_3]